MRNWVWVSQILIEGRVLLPPLGDARSVFELSSRSRLPASRFDPALLSSLVGLLALLDAAQPLSLNYYTRCLPWYSGVPPATDAALQAAPDGTVTGGLGGYFSHPPHLLVH